MRLASAALLLAVLGVGLTVGAWVRGNSIQTRLAAIERENKNLHLQILSAKADAAAASYEAAKAQGDASLAKFHADTDEIAKYRDLANRLEANGQHDEAEKVRVVIANREKDAAR